MNQHLKYVASPSRQYQMMKLAFLAMVALAAVACSDPSSLDSYVGEWHSGFGDTDEHGKKVNRAWLLKIESDHSFTLRYIRENNDSWQSYTSGRIKIITINNGGSRSSGIQIGTASGCFYAGGLDVTVGGELRTFNRPGGLSWIVWVIICLAIMVWFVKSLWEDHQNYRAQ